MTPRWAAVLSLVVASSTVLPAADVPFASGERLTFRLTYLHLFAGRAILRVEPPPPDSTIFRLTEEARSEGFFAWLFHYRVDDHVTARWDAEGGCSDGIEKRLREGKAARDQDVRFDAVAGVATVRDPKIAATRFDVEPCVLDVLSALYVTRLREVSESKPLFLPVFDNGKHYRLGVRRVGRESLDLPAPLGKKTATVILEPQLLEETGLFVKEGRLKIWLTDDARRIPVRMQSRVPLGAITADLESYEVGR